MVLSSPALAHHVFEYLWQKSDYGTQDRLKDGWSAPLPAKEIEARRVQAQQAQREVLKKAEDKELPASRLRFLQSRKLPSLERKGLYAPLLGGGNGVSCQ